MTDTTDTTDKAEMTVSAEIASRAIALRLKASEMRNRADGEKVDVEWWATSNDIDLESSEMLALQRMFAHAGAAAALDQTADNLTKLFKQIREQESERKPTRTVSTVFAVILTALSTAGIVFVAGAGLIRLVSWILP